MTLVQEDFLEHTKQTIVETEAILKGDTLLYFEKDRTYKHKVRFQEKQVDIYRDGEFSSHTCLKSSEKGETRVYSPYGVMVMENQLCSKKHEHNVWYVEYKLKNGTETVSHQKMTWNIRYFA